MNEFQLDFYSRLRAWNSLREGLKDSTVDAICVNVDKFWQQSPMSTYYLHPADIATWPDPWQLLDDNLYCPYARALGMIYTLLLLGVQDIVLVDAIDYNNVDVVLVLVDDAKYVMNYWPGTMLNNKLEDFKIVRTHDIVPIKKKAGLL